MFRPSALAILRIAASISADTQNRTGTLFVRFSVAITSCFETKKTDDRRSKEKPPDRIRWLKRLCIRLFKQFGRQGKVEYNGIHFFAQWNTSKSRILYANCYAIWLFCRCMEYILSCRSFSTSGKKRVKPPKRGLNGPCGATLRGKILFLYPPLSRLSLDICFRSELPVFV